MGEYTAVKQLVQDYYAAIESASAEEVKSTLADFVPEQYDWMGSYPFRRLAGAEQVADKFWKPLKNSISFMQRRQDIFIAGHNELAPSEVWVMSMGNFFGNFVEDFLGIRHTNKIITLRYAEFSCVENGKISRTGLFVDLIGFMIQAGVNPLPQMEGAWFVFPGPRGHDGLLFEDAAAEEGAQTLKLIDDMCREVVPYDADVDVLPEQGATGYYWTQDMLWYGSTGSAFTIPFFEKYQQLFRGCLKDRKFVGHVARFAEGNFGCFFGWPNIINTPIGGYLGLPGGQCPAEMQVVDVYCRRGELLSENWVILDIPYWLSQQGLDLFAEEKA